MFVCLFALPNLGNFYLCMLSQKKKKKIHTNTSSTLGLDVSGKCGAYIANKKVDPLWLQRETDAESLTCLSACTRLHGPRAPSGRRQPAPTITQAPSLSLSVCSGRRKT